MNRSGEEPEEDEEGSLSPSFERLRAALQDVVRGAPQNCITAVVRAIISSRGKEPVRLDQWLRSENGNFLPIEPPPFANGVDFSSAALSDYAPTDLGEVFDEAQECLGSRFRVSVVVALFWENANGGWHCHLLTRGVNPCYLGERESRVRELLGGPEDLLSRHATLSADDPDDADAEVEQRPSERDRKLGAGDPESEEVLQPGEAAAILTQQTAGQILEYWKHWPPISHLEDAKARLLSGGFLGMTTEALDMIVRATLLGEEDEERARSLTDEIHALVSVNTCDAHTWLECWRRWKTLEDVRVEIVPNNEWKELLRKALSDFGLNPNGLEPGSGSRGQTPRERYAARTPSTAELAADEVRFLLTHLFRPDLPNRLVTVEVLQILTSGRSGALTFLVQPHLQIVPTVDDPASGVDSRIGRVCVVKVDDVGLIAREHAGFTNVVDRYLYSYAARISRVAKAYRLGALAYASIGGLDDYSVDLSGASGPISLREFVRGGARHRGSRRPSPVVSSPSDMADLVMALDRCVFADLHQDSHSGKLSFAHYSDTLPPDYRVSGTIAFIARSPDRRVRFMRDLVKRPQLGACEGRVISVDRESMYIIGNVFRPLLPTPENLAETQWERLSEQDASIGKENCLIEIKANTPKAAYAGRQKVATFVGLAKHMPTETLPMLQLVAYGEPERNHWNIGSGTLTDTLATRKEWKNLTLLPWCLLGMLRNDLVHVRARIGSVHGDLNLTNVLVTFMTKPNQSLQDDRFDPRCWLIDYGKTRLDGHTGRDYGQLEVGLRREVIAPIYMNLCRQLTAAANVSREQARRIVLAYHWLLEEQFIRHDTAPTDRHSVDLEFETIAFTDRILPVYKSLADPADVTSRIEAARDQAYFTGQWLRAALLEHEAIELNKLPHVVFVHISSNQMLRRCYHMLRLLRQLAIMSGHDRIEQAWAQMLTSIAIFRRATDAENRLDALEREVVFLSALVAAEEIRWNLGSRELAKLEERLAAAASSSPIPLVSDDIRRSAEDVAMS